MSTRSPEMFCIYQSAVKLDDEVLHFIHHLLQTSMEFIRADKCSLELYDEHQRSFEVIAQVVWTSAAGTQQVEGTKGDFRDTASNDLDPIPHVVTVLSAPLLHRRGKLVGIISAYFCRTHRPTKHEFRFRGFAGSKR